MAKSVSEVKAMIQRIERNVDENTGAFLMALEWVVGEGVSTSVGLEGYLDEAGEAAVVPVEVK